MPVKFLSVLLTLALLHVSCSSTSSDSNTSGSDGDSDIVENDETEFDSEEDEGDIQESDTENTESIEAPVTCNGFVLNWDKLKNPILSRQDRMIKDQTIKFHDGWVYLFASQRFAEGEAAEAVFFRSRDLVDWEEWSDEDVEVFGSPEVVQTGDGFVMTFQAGSDPENDFMRRLYYSTSTDLYDWTPPIELAPGVHESASIIDGCVAPLYDGRLVLGYKHRSIQLFFVTISENGLSGPWSEPLIAWPGGELEWAENYQFLKVDDEWRMVATSKDPTGRACDNDYTCNHEPFIYRLEGDDSDLEGWTKWTDKTLLQVPYEDWNTDMHANTGHLVDRRSCDGWFYLFYAGSNDHESFNGRGHGKIGIARSKNLQNWETP